VPEPQAEPKTGVGVLDKALAVVAAVERGDRTLRAIAASTRLPKPTVHRLLASLAEHGVVAEIDGVGYALGPRLIQLGARAARELPLRELARPTLERLARATGESAQLFVRVGDRRICVDAVESANELRTIVPVGASLPLDKGSAGRVFLAWASPGDPSFASTRRRGWAESHEEREPGVASVSAPVVDALGQVLAAVSVSGPVARIDRRRAATLGPTVAEAGREIGAGLGRAQEAATTAMP
jgi:DNA-binding IclR family transcriptional regulator